MENETLTEADIDALVESIVPGTMSGAEMIEFYKRVGAFRDYPEIGPGRQYANSTEYVLAKREEAAKRSRETA